MIKICTKCYPYHNGKKVKTVKMFIIKAQAIDMDTDN